MFRSLSRPIVLLALSAIALASPAGAFTTEDAVAATGPAALHDIAGIKGFGLVANGGQFRIANDPLKSEPRFATAGLSFARDGWSVSLVGGGVDAATPAGSGPVLPMAVFTLAREVANVASGTLSLEFSSRHVWEDGERGEVRSLNLRWGRQF